MKYVCYECGNTLEVSIEGDTIEVIPCEHCLGTEYELGREDGFDNGYENGFAEGLNNSYE